MYSQTVLFLVAIGAAHVADARNSIRSQPKVAAIAVNRINPELRPKSDNKFMHDDYPSDERPRENGLAFEHPYPVVQETHNYDYDYVKDENSDNGEWKSQMQYDEARAKMHKIIKETEAAKREMDAQYKDYQKAIEHEKQAEIIAEKAEVATGVAKGVEVDKAQDVEDLRAKTAAAADEVEKEMVDLEECKKQLADTRAKLKELVEKTEKAEQEKKEADAAMESADKEEAAAEKLEEEAQEKLKVETTEAAVAKDGYKAQIKELKKTESDLEKAEKRLRKYRMKVDHKGGVYRPTDEPAPPKAGAPAAAFVSMLAASVAALALLF
eukprot:gnl/TRDRNA2_/TRDRNA2_168384_c1_seq4.p2 gnl/TRDRNA2_/TRDRNA2_168384_c1~~gnl/TRDRNA2_/TRDRNA2_168384_c1_seq4.p2  ORF type:complete len:325 (+),score=124.13 gnl/TRDRNA2_/TRDRNA2_168384_c1_seq4:67-1041(+)